MSFTIHSKKLTHRIDISGRVQYYTSDIIINTTQHEIKLINHKIGKTLSFSVTGKPQEYSEAFLCHMERSAVNNFNEKQKLDDVSYEFNILFRIIENKLIVFRIKTLEKPYFKILTYVTKQMVITCYDLDTFEQQDTDTIVDEIGSFELLCYNSNYVMLQLYDSSYQSKIVLINLSSMYSIYEFPRCTFVSKHNGCYSDYVVLFNDDTKKIFVHNLTKQFGRDGFMNAIISDVVDYKHLQNYPPIQEGSQSLLITTATDSRIVRINTN